MSEPSPFSGAPAPRMMPQAVEAERGLLCALLIAPIETATVCHRIGVALDWFHVPAHRELFEAVLALHESGKGIDAVTLTQRLFDIGRLEAVGGPAYVSELSGYLPTAIHAEHYAEILAEKRTLREVISVAGRAERAAYDEQDEVSEMLAGFERDVIAIRRKQRTQSQFTAREAANLGLAELQRKVDMRGKISGISTGFASLDKLTDGLHPAELIVLAARPSLGKTALAMQLVEHAAIEHGKRVAFFSLEMGRTQVSERLIASRARVNTVPWRYGKAPTEAEMQRIALAAPEVAKMPVIFEDGSDVTIAGVRASARGMAMRERLDLIVIDSLSVLRSTSKQARENRHREVAECANGAKEMAKELGVPVILIAHLKREAKDGVRPSLAELRESSNIEQDADGVWMLWQPKQEGDDNASPAVELYLPKNRNGEQHVSASLIFEKQFTRFREVETDETVTQGEMI